MGRIEPNSAHGKELSAPAFSSGLTKCLPAGTVPAVNLRRTTLSAFLLLALLAVPCPAVIKSTKSDYWEMAQKALQQNDLDAALDALDALLKDSPEHVQGRLWRARILADKDQLDEAMNDIEAVLKAEPQNASARAQRGYIHQKKGEL